MIHASLGRRTKSMALRNGRKTIWFSKLFGLAGNLNQDRANSPVMSNGPTLTEP
jgi:hypothetical protein